MRCLQNYTRHGNRYKAGQDYDIDPEVVEAHEAYWGSPLWEEAKKPKKTKKEKAAKPKKARKKKSSK